MPQHAETRPSPHSAKQLFDLVADVRRYPDFLPWCQGARVRANRLMASGAQESLADLIIGFQAFRESFTSRVIANPAALTIESHLVKGPFSHLENHWRFEDTEQGCNIHFAVEFSFNSRVLSAVVEPLFMTAQRKMVLAFEQRADQLYGSDT